MTTRILEPTLDVLAADELAIVLELPMLELLELLGVAATAHHQ